MSRTSSIVAGSPILTMFGIDNGMHCAVQPISVLQGSYPPLLPDGPQQQQTRTICALCLTLVVFVELLQFM